jgi:predicted HAD superfamily Cof-like phosphohydrolase
MTRMLSDQLADVYEFQRKFGHAYDGSPRVPAPSDVLFRLRFLGEELRELGEALGVRVDVAFERLPGRATDRQLLAGALDALVDLDYVLKGTVLQLGLGAVYEEAWRRVQAANLRKVPGVKSTRGYARDVVKPAGWVAPDLSDLVIADAAALAP